MEFKQIPLRELVVNPSNDRHGDQGSESAAITWLFENKPSEMMALIKDIAETRGLLDAPLVLPEENYWVVYDGNRRVTALKALAGLVGVPNGLVRGVESAGEAFKPTEGELISCQVGETSEMVNTTLSRRHGGTDGGRGQLRWDTRAKANYARRVGSNSQYPIAEAIEEWLEENGYPHSKKIKRSTLYRLVNTKKRQSLFGIQLAKDSSLQLTGDKGKTKELLTTVADDIVNGDLTLNNVLNSQGIDAYLSEPRISSKLQQTKESESKQKKKDPERRHTRRPKQRDSLIPKDIIYELTWRPGHGKIQRLWQELTYDLSLSRNPVSVPLAFRTLLEISCMSAGSIYGIRKTKSTAGYLKQVAEKLAELGALTIDERKDFDRFCNDNGSKREFEALHRAVHGPGYVAAADDMIAMWNIAEPFLIAAISSREPT